MHLYLSVHPLEVCYVATSHLKLGIILVKLGLTDLFHSLLVVFCHGTGCHFVLLVVIFFSVIFTQSITKYSMLFDDSSTFCFFFNP